MVGRKGDGEGVRGGERIGEDGKMGGARRSGRVAVGDVGERVDVEALGEDHAALPDEGVPEDEARGVVCGVVAECVCCVCVSAGMLCELGPGQR